MTYVNTKIMWMPHLEERQNLLKDSKAGRGFFLDPGLTL